MQSHRERCAAAGAQSARAGRRGAHLGACCPPDPPICYCYIGPLGAYFMAERKAEPEYVDPLPKEYYDSVERFNREVLDRASEIPKDELERLMAAERERRWPYMQKESKAACEYLCALVGVEPAVFKDPSELEGSLAKYFPHGFDSVEAVRAVRGRGP